MKLNVLNSCYDAYTNTSYLVKAYAKEVFANNDNIIDKLKIFNFIDDFLIVPLKNTMCTSKL